ncbi:MAG: EAL domain-containing protein [Bryobacterales bacterium]|nr:EAL domain-containing protein [Bryobacterales bacterium]
MSSDGEVRLGRKREHVRLVASAPLCAAPDWQNRMRALALDSLAASVALIDPAGVIQEVNGRWAELAEACGMNDPGHGVGRNYLQFEGVNHEAAAVIQAIRTVLAGDGHYRVVDYRCDYGGRRRWFRCGVSALRENGQTVGAVVTHEEVSDQVALLEESVRQSAALQAVTNSIVITDCAGRIEWVNDAFRRASGLELNEARLLPAHRWRDYAGGRAFSDIAEYCRLSRDVWTGEVELARKGGAPYLVEQTVTPVTDSTGRVSHLIVVSEDLTEYRQTQRRLLHLAEHDHLTGLLNRRSFQDRLALAVEQHASIEQPLAVIVLNLERFKNTNDTLGHRAGDAVLEEVARRLSSEMRPGDGLARVGADEFVLFRARCGDREQVRRLVARLQERLSEPIEVAGRRVPASCRAGVTLFPGDAHRPDELLRRAGLALHRAKADGPCGFRFYDSGIDAEMGVRAWVEREVAQAVGTPSLGAAYQPIWELATGRITGAEGLMRWSAGASSGVTVSRIVEIAEDSGLIQPIGQWVIAQALDALARWRRKPSACAHLSLAVNLSAVQLNQAGLSTSLLEELRRRGLPPSCLKVELTETVLLQESPAVAETLERLHEAGVGLVLDDFGTGYASLSYLQRFPIEQVKIDGRFIAGIGSRAPDEAIVRAIVQLAHSLGLKVVAEGVETEAQREFLERAGCDLAQGFLLSPAVTAAKFEALVRQSGTAPRVRRQ